MSSLRLLKPALACAIALTCGLVMTGCVWIGEEILESGTTGLSVDDSGSVIVLVKVCEVEMNQVLIFRSGPDDPTMDPDGLDNEQVGIWKSKHPLDQGVHELNLSAPGSVWETKTKATLDIPNRVYGIGADNSENTSTVGVDASTEAIRNLEAGQVLVGDVETSRTITRTEFDALDC